MKKLLLMGVMAAFLSGCAGTSPVVLQQAKQVPPQFNPAVEKQVIKKDKENIFRISLGPWRRPRLLPM